MVQVRAWVFGAALGAFALVGSAMAETLDKGDGIHTEDWFQNQSFGDLRDEVAEAAAKGKLLAVVWEQQGCGSCARLHEVNFQDPAVRAYLDKHFTVMTLNMYGEVGMTDTDGEALPEKDLAAKAMINFTPTTVFYDETGAEVFRLPGYFAPYFYLSGFVYVAEKGYADPDMRGMFARWAKVRRDHLVEIYGSEPKG